MSCAQRRSHQRRIPAAIQAKANVAIDEAGRASFETVITSDELDGQLTSMEAEVEDGRITYVVRLDWEKTG